MFDFVKVTFESNLIYFRKWTVHTKKFLGKANFQQQLSKKLLSVKAAYSLEGSLHH